MIKKTRAILSSVVRFAFLYAAIIMIAWGIYYGQDYKSMSFDFKDDDSCVPLQYSKSTDGRLLAILYSNKKSDYDSIHTLKLYSIHSNVELLSYRGNIDQFVIDSNGSLIFVTWNKDNPRKDTRHEQVRCFKPSNGELTILYDGIYPEISTRKTLCSSVTTDYITSIVLSPDGASWITPSPNLSDAANYSITTSMDNGAFVQLRCRDPNTNLEIAAEILGTCFSADGKCVLAYCRASVGGNNQDWLQLNDIYTGQVMASMSLTSELIQVCMFVNNRFVIKVKNNDIRRRCQFLYCRLTSSGLVSSILDEIQPDVQSGHENARDNRHVFDAVVQCMVDPEQRTLVTGWTCCIIQPPEVLGENSTVVYYSDFYYSVRDFLTGRLLMTNCLRYPVNLVAPEVSPLQSMKAVLSGPVVVLSCIYSPNKGSIKQWVDKSTEILTGRPSFAKEDLLFVDGHSGKTGFRTSILPNSNHVSSRISNGSLAIDYEYGKVMLLYRMPGYSHLIFVSLFCLIVTIMLMILWKWCCCISPAKAVTL